MDTVHRDHFAATLHKDLEYLTIEGIRRSEKLETNRKGRDIGYALAASSCEGANRVDACTVTTPDVITAFAVPNPNCSSQSQSVFSGLVACRVAPVCRSLGLLRTGNFLFSPTLSTVDGSQLKRLHHESQRPRLVHSQNSFSGFPAS